MTSLRRGGLVLALAVCLGLLWLWFRLGQSAESAATGLQDQPAEESAFRGSELVAAADPDLLRTQAPGLTSAEVSPPAAELEAAVEIAGRLVFTGGTDYPLPFSGVQVITDAPVVGKEHLRLGGDQFGSRVLFLVPVTDDGRFSFRIPAAQASAQVSAIGPSCIATQDVLATVGTPAEIPMAFFYCGAIALRDADSGATLEEVTNLSLQGGGIVFTVEQGARTAIRSTLALLCFKRQVPFPEPKIALRQAFTTANSYPQGLPLTVHARAPGFAPLEAGVLLPGYTGELSIQQVDVHSEAKVRCAIALTIERPGDWSGADSCEYFGTGSLSIPSDERGFEPLITYLSLIPGVLELRGIPFQDPRLWYESEATVRTRESPKPVELTLTAPRSSGQPYTAKLAIMESCALYFPARADLSGEYAWLSHVRLSDGKLGARRYAVRKGVILDGLRPDRYQVFWAESQAELTRLREGNLPFADLTLVPGLNRLPAPP